MIRNARASIDLSALQHNFQRVKQLAPSSRVMPVIKADAYGHGMIQVAQCLQQADAFAVAQFGEAMALREAGINHPITVFQGFQNQQQLQLMLEHKIRPAVHQLWQIELIEQLTAGQLSVWLKINSGMGRLGIQQTEAEPAWHRLQQAPVINELGLMSHFANADEPEHPANQQQIACFQQLASQFNAETSLANSAGLIAFSDIQGDWVRPGIMLYGASPFANKTAAELGLQPVMQLTADLLAINLLRKGATIGYGDLWACPEDMPVGIVGVGYGDGYPRHAGTGTPVWINGRETQLLGRVSMDSVAIDLRNIDRPRCGDEVVMWGPELTVDRVAKCADTIAYELLCNASSCR
ncbi:MAG: alanine racemase [Gammaproteobacteria bacterium]|nr:alanine racemase [Gammaproteobacteria bacterium]